jgi:ATP-dependent 26S proteasome regulatory subunit
MIIHSEMDHQSLAAAIDWLRRLLVAYVADDEAVSDSPHAPWPVPLVLRTLGQQLGLSIFEQKVLLLCAAPELDPSLAELYAAAQGNNDCLFPTFSLALTLFDSASLDVLAKDGPLRHWQLVSIDHSRQRPLVVSPLQADERIVNYLMGLNRLDSRLRPYLLSMRRDSKSILLPPSQQHRVEQALARLNQADTTERWPILQLVGSDALSKQLIAQQLAEELGAQLYALPAQLIPTGTHDLEEFARLWYRESLLLPLALYIDASELDMEGPGSEQAQRVRQFLMRSNGLFLLSTHDVWQDLGEDSSVLDIQKPAQAEQMATWQEVLPHDARDVAEQLSAQFNLNLSTIHQIMRSILVGEEAAVDMPLDARIWQACLAHTRPRMDMLAQRITPKATWNDIVLDDQQRALLRHIVEQVNQRNKVYETWGFRRRSSRGLGMAVLFAGESGTGKTMAAEILANHLKLNLYRIDLSAVVSKYIGETEKNLRRLFDAAEDGGALLFFDEADALFGKRSEVRDSHDRYANIEVNYLLQRLEAYQGLAILATNLKSGLDDAFARRLRFSITFPKPDEYHRLQIWERAFPQEVPLGELDYVYLAKTFKLSGGSIYNVALNAAFMAASEDVPVSMAHLLSAIRIELGKEDRLLNERDFLWQKDR